MLARLSVSFAALILGLVVPILEINDTHLFNSLWPAHARLHEAWQLLANISLSLLALWLAWRGSAERLASAIMLAATGSFVVAFIAQAAYGGSMRHTDGSELMVAGVNPAFGVMLLASILLAAAIARDLASPPGTLASR
jgi:hypothetical protein